MASSDSSLQYSNFNPQLPLASSHSPSLNVRSFVNTRISHGIRGPIALLFAKLDPEFEIKSFSSFKIVRSSIVASVELESIDENMLSCKFEELSNTRVGHSIM